MMRSLGPDSPKVDSTAYVHPSAEIIGRVEIGKSASIWPLAVLRGDVNKIIVGARSNIQDLTVIHGRAAYPTIIGQEVTVGHNVIVHGALIGDRCLIGMGAIVMEAVIGERCLIAAGTLVLAGMKIPPRSLVLGSPAKVVRKLNAKELRSLKISADNYLRYAQQHRSSSNWVPAR